MKYCTFSIILTTNYSLQCSILTETEQIPIQLIPNLSEYPCIISIQNDEIFYCQEKENSQTITFIEEFFSQSQEKKEYKFKLHEKEYTFLPETLFAMIIREFKSKIEKEYIIDETYLQLPTDSFQLIERIRTSLQAIKLKNIVVNEFDYQQLIQQEEMMNNLFNDHEIYLFDTQKSLYRLDNYCIFIASRYLNDIDDYINLEKVTKRFRGNLSKFHYNPIPLTIATRPFFTHLKTLYLYSNDDNRFFNDKQIIERKYLFTFGNSFEIKGKQLQFIEEWTGKICGEIVFDSKRDKWGYVEEEYLSSYVDEIPDFNEKINQRKELLFFIQTSRGDIGYYLNTKIIKNEYDDDEGAPYNPTDEKSFAFRLDIDNQQYPPMKFEIKNTQKGYRMYYLIPQRNDHLFDIGDIHMMKEGSGEDPYYIQNDLDYDYHGIENALCQPSSVNAEKQEINIQKFMVIQMKQSNETRVDESIQSFNDKLTHLVKRENIFKSISVPVCKVVRTFEDLKSKQISKIIFDSKDQWPNDSASINEILIGKQHVLFCIEDESKRLFGYYFDQTIKNEFRKRQTGMSTYHFFYNPNEGGCIYLSSKWSWGSSGLTLYQQTNEKQLLIRIGDILLLTNSKKQESSWEKNYNNFNYGNKKYFVSNTSPNEQEQLFFNPSRFMIILFE